MRKVVLAIDPGSRKCGFAVVARYENTDSIELLAHSVASVEDLEDVVDLYRKEYQPSLVIVGDGTRSQTIVERIRAYAPGLGVLVVDEKDTSQEARARYWEHNKRSGWRKLLPSTMQTPPVPVDDFVALILAERVLME